MTICVEEKCSESPSYNFKGIPKKYCVNHKEDDMIHSTAFCQHSNLKYRCVECNGSGICKHGTLK